MSADLKAEAARYYEAFIKANDAVAVREEAIERLTAERDRARDIAVALEQRLARVEALVTTFEQRQRLLKGRAPTKNARRVSINALDGREASSWGVAAYDLRAALEVDL